MRARFLVIVKDDTMFLLKKVMAVSKVICVEGCESKQASKQARADGDQRANFQCKNLLASFVVGTIKH